MGKPPCKGVFAGVPHPDGAICEELPDPVAQLAANLVRAGAAEGAPRVQKRSEVGCFFWLPVAAGELIPCFFEAEPA